jgi:hypothetical protein
MQYGQSFVYGFSHSDPSTGSLCVRSIEVAMPPIFSSPTGVHAFLVEDQIPEIRGNIQADFENLCTRTPRSSFIVDGFDHIRDLICRSSIFYDSLTMSFEDVPRIPYLLSIKQEVACSFCRDHRPSEKMAGNLSCATIVKWLKPALLTP